MRFCLCLLMFKNISYLFRIYLRLPQCSYLQDMMPLRRCVVLSSATFLISILVIIFIHSYYVVDSVSSNSTPHFLPTVDYRRDKAQFTSRPNVHYGIVLDCGSSGSRVYVYVWPPHSGNPHDLLNIQELKDQYNQPVVKKISPGTMLCNTVTNSVLLLIQILIKMFRIYFYIHVDKEQDIPISDIFVIFIIFRE